jgi:predicted RNA binding protein YcfA (HicA-like mRNA interferase family)
MSTQVSDSIRFYLEEPISSEYPHHVNNAIEANRAFAKNGFYLDHQNGNHTVWVMDNIRIVVTRCEDTPISTHVNF